MGVYIIKSKHSNWVKIGHHKITERRPNVYFRYIHRGFYSCMCPTEIKEKVSFEDLELLYWFDNLNLQDEKNIHQYLETLYYKCGEWYKITEETIETVKNIIINKFNGILKEVSDDELIVAKQFYTNMNKNNTNNCIRKKIESKNMNI
jgi:hypothetical protein